MTTIKHGKYTAYKHCRLRPEGSCDPCRAAHSAYVAEWRRRSPVRFAGQVAQQAARERALRRLARLFPAEFRVLYDEELAPLAEQREAS